MNKRIYSIGIILFIVLISIAIYFFMIKTSEKLNLPKDICVYDDRKDITCGTAFVIVLEGIEYPLTANEPYNFPEGENEMIGLVDKSKPEGEQGFLLFLEEGEHTINEETSRKAVGSFLAKRLTG